LKAGETYKVKDQTLTLEDIPMDFDTIAACGSMAGSGGVIVMDDSRDMVECLNNINEFYAHESCGQCTPCREGALWMKKITDRMVAGGGTDRDPDQLKTIGDNIAGKTICAFGEACSWPTQSFVLKFREEFLAKGQKPLPPPMPDDAFAPLDDQRTAISQRGEIGVGVSHSLDVADGEVAERGHGFAFGLQQPGRRTAC